MTETEYKKKIEQFRIESNKSRNRSRLYLLGKLSAFSLAATFVYIAYNNPNATNIAAIILFGILYVMFCILDSSCIKKIQSFESQINVCKNEIGYLNGNFTPFNDGKQYIDPKHEFTYDLDIFGKNSLFNRINRTITQGGSQLLAHKLSHITTDRKEIEENQEAIDELKHMDEWRIRFISNPTTENSIADFGNIPETGKTKNMLYASRIPYLLVFLTLASLACCSLDMLPWRVFTSMFLIQCFISIIISKTTTDANINTGKLHKEYAAYLRILNDIHQTDTKSSKLNDIKARLFDKDNNSLIAFKQLSRILNMFDQRGNVIMYILLNGTLLFDLMLTRKFIHWKKQYSSHNKTWMEAISEIDALTSLATYAYNNPTNHYAKILDEGAENIIEATNVYHPFLKHEKAVPNSFTLKKKNISIITGANMAGKSTFLRTIGITYILASNGTPVCAEAFSFGTVTLFSSMRTSDDLSNDVSYFNAELLRLKQLIEHVKTHHYTLIILDEILKGTNSKDKLKGSIMFLNEISRYNISAIIATHDLELSKLEDEHKDIYNNYCFEIELSDDIQYTYKIQRGVAQNLNASYLLANILKSISE